MPRTQYGERVNGKALRRLRVVAGLTTRELGAKAGVSYQTLLRLENAQGNAQLATIRKIAEALNVSHMELLTLDDEATSGRAA